MTDFTAASQGSSRAADHANPSHIDASHIDASPIDPLRGALLDSRQRWHDLVCMAADFAFETDEWGRFVFVMPDTVVGWPSAMLVGQPSELLLTDDSGASGFNPFRPTVAIRRRRAWLRCPDGSVACMTFAAAPLLDAAGRIAGARGVATDVTEQDGHDARVAAALRRGEVIDHILRCMRQEVLAPRMMQAVLDGLVSALGVEGASVVDLVGGEGRPELLHRAGQAVETVLPHAARLLTSAADVPAQLTAPDGRHLLGCICLIRYGGRAGLVLWRRPGGRGWDSEDHGVVASAAAIVRVVLEHEAIQREMARLARTDPLTGLMNRRAFLEELARHIDRLDREDLPGTLLFTDLDNFKSLNDQQGHETGDQALCAVANLLRDSVRPTDLIARLGGDEFAIWLNGADHMTAAERAEALRIDGPRKLMEVAGLDGPTLTMSIGIATRRAGSGERIEALIHRADAAMYAVKRNGRGHWMVAHGSPAQNHG
jgi:diguanylate cyclase (GGDEF)-like protein